MHTVRHVLCDVVSVLLSADETKLPGYQPIPENAPQWKKAMIEKKNQSLVEDARVGGAALVYRA